MGRHMLFRERTEGERPLNVWQLFSYARGLVES